ncbi:hypothetical protein Ancab_031057 [Ancistrocladus abbreviatus]
MSTAVLGYQKVVQENRYLYNMFQDLKGGHAKTLMFAHVSPEGDDFGETLSTLKFARRVSSIELGAACLNKQSSEVRELKQQFLVHSSEDLDFMQIENLKKALVSKETQNSQQLNNQPTTSTRKKAKEAVMEVTPLQSQRMSIEYSRPTNTKKVQNAGPEKPKEPRTPCEKPKIMLEQTLPRPQRRLSIENSSSTKPYKTQPERTSPSSRRLSIKNSRTMQVEKVQYAESSKNDEEKSLRGDKMGMPQRTPQSRLHSHENPSSMKSDKVMKTANKTSYKTPSLATKHGNEPSFSRGECLGQNNIATP